MKTIMKCLWFACLLAGASLVSAEDFDTATFTRTDLAGIGPERGVSRRDPSDVVKVGDLYYVWYSRGPIKPGYNATVWYATSPDGVQWTERGVAVGKNPKAGSWDEASVFTPNILFAEAKYWLFYTGISKNPEPRRPDSKIGIAFSDSPDGPWERLPNNPVLKNSRNRKDFDSHLVDDSCLIVRDGKYWLYYKGRQLGKSPGQTQMGLAIADAPEGPYLRHPENPVIPGNHEVLVWPQGGGVAAMIGTTGPKDIVNTVRYAEDGINFAKVYNIENGPWAGGSYRPEAFTDSNSGGPPAWGVEIAKGYRLLCLRRFDVEWPQQGKALGFSPSRDIIASAAKLGGSGRNGLARNTGQTPPMGWNSYNRFGLGVSAQLIKEIADGIKKHKLDEAGYKYIVMDDGWQSKHLRPNGELRCDGRKFPDGIPPLVEYVNGLGLELGIYSSPNKWTCGGRAGSLGNEDIHAEQFSDWGIKFVKYDYAPSRNKERDLPKDEIVKRYGVFHEAIARHDPEIVVAICEKGWADKLYKAQRETPVTPEQRRAAFDWCSEVGVMWRTTGDIKARWSRIMQILDAQEGLAPLSGPNSFNNPDMLEVGNGKLSDAENRAHFSLWCILNAPLILGNDLRDIPKDVLEIIANKELIALNQDPLCKQAVKVVDAGRIEIFSKPLANGDLGVCILNRGGSPKTVTVEWEQLGLKTGSKFEVRDLWSHKDLGLFSDAIEASVDSHDVVVYRISKRRGE